LPSYFWIGNNKPRYEYFNFIFPGTYSTMRIYYNTCTFLTMGLKMLYVCKKTLRNLTFNQAAYLGSPKGGLAAEILHHSHLCRRSARLFLGREAELGHALSYLASPENRGPFLVYGQSGAGKTAFLSKLCTLGMIIGFCYSLCMVIFSVSISII
jgi:hypothetical protein